MINQDHKIIDFKKENKTIVKSINLDNELDLFLIVSSKNHTFAELVFTKILDTTIDKISITNTYKDFSITLEHLNTLLRTWRAENKWDTTIDISVFIAVLNKSNFYFSNIWNPSAYLVKDTNEVVEITEKEEKKREFNFISEWKLDFWDTIVLASSRLLNYLSYSDFTDSSIWKKSPDVIKNIELIMQEEKIDTNVALLVLKYNFLVEKTKKENKFVQIFHKYAYKSLDNVLVKFIVWHYMFVKEYTIKQNKNIKNALYITWIASSIIVLFVIINSITWTSIKTNQAKTDKQALLDAREYIKQANENSAHSDLFEVNISKAEEIITELRKKKLFSSDLEKMTNDLSVIKKQYNSVETFTETKDNLSYDISTKYEKDSIKSLKIAWKLYLVNKTNVVWPILEWKEAKTYEFKELKSDYFIDAVVYNEGIMMITNTWKVVEFSINGYFSYKDVKNQKTWEQSNTINTYNQNLYLLPNDVNQILKHEKAGKIFWQAIPYLTEADSNSIWKIFDIAIDGWVYILKKDLSIIKAFSSPYRLEKIVINKLPKNYNIENIDNTIMIEAKSNLNYVYLLLNNKIWVLEPNTRNVKDVKSLTYLWQIEWLKYKIKDFSVDHDWEINVLNENGIYKLSFEINDGKVIVR